MTPRQVALFAGKVGNLPGDSRPSGIVKLPVAGRVRILASGIDGDEQADRRVHGGPDKALHFFAAGHYARLAERFPEAAALLVPGSIGENVSATGLEEAEVCIGDVLALGSARVQVCQPRQPCWKIDARFGVTGMTAFVAESAMTGGYWRVLEAGMAESGDLLTLIDRPPAAPTLAEFWQLFMAHRPDLDRLHDLAQTPGLSANWQRKVAERIAWLRQHADRPAA